MSAKYAFGKTVTTGFEQTLERVTQELGLDMPAYRILGACNPRSAHRALALEPRLERVLAAV